MKGRCHGTPRVRGYTLVEMIGAIAILSLAGGCFFASLSAVQRLEQVYWSETRAVIVLHNVIERIRAEGATGEDRMGTLLQEEFSQGGLPPRSRPVAQRDPARGVTVIGIVRDNGKPLARVEVAP